MKRRSVMALIGAFALGLPAMVAAQPRVQTPAQNQQVPARPRSEPQTPVDLNLVLAVDASGSVDDSRFELQKQGYAKAFINPRVLAAIRNGNEQAIAVSMVQWTGPTLHVIAVPWMIVRDQRSAELLAAAIERAPRQIFGGGTSLSGAIDFSVLLLRASPYMPTRQVIDISGDGSNNIGRPPAQARDEAVKMGIRINGLPILTVEPDLDIYYRQNVVGGPGAFVIPAKSYDEFASAILRKLVAEISQDQVPASSPRKFALRYPPFRPPSLLRSLAALGPAKGPLDLSLIGPRSPSRGEGKTRLRATALRKKKAANIGITFLPPLRGKVPAQRAEGGYA